MQKYESYNTFQVINKVEQWHHVKFARSNS